MQKTLTNYQGLVDEAINMKNEYKDRGRAARHHHAMKTELAFA